MANKPKDEKLKKRIDQACANVNEHISQPGKSRSKLAIALGLSPSTLSPFLNGIYQGNLENVCVKIEAFFDLEKQRRGIVREPEFVSTRQSDEIWNFVTLAHAYRTISVIVGDSGLGKTRTLKEYAKNPNVYYVQCHPYMRGRTGFLQQLCLTLNIAAMGNQIVCFNRLAGEASQKGALIILDDAQTLNQRNIQNTTVFEVIRALHDLGVGFVICGNDRVRESVTQNDSEELYQQFAARSKILKLDSKFRIEDLRDILHGLLNGYIGEDELEYLFKIATQYYGSLHIVIQALVLAVTIARAKKISLTVALLKQASRHFISQKKPEHKTKNHGVQLNVKEQKNDLPYQEPVGRQAGSTRIESA